MAKQTFTTGQVLTAAQMTSLQQTAMGGGSTTAKTVSYTLVAADAGTVIQMNSASATTITVNTALFAAGDTVQIQNIGAGVCTVTAGTATVNTAGSLALSQYENGTLYFNSTSAAFFFDVFQTGSTSGPAFKAFLSADTGTISAATYTKVPFANELFDTANCFSTVNNRFTPTTSGYYNLAANVETGANVSATYSMTIYFNGTRYSDLAVGGAGSNLVNLGNSDLLYFNGSTDYAEIFFITSASTLVFSGQASPGFRTHFAGVWIRS